MAKFSYQERKEAARQEAIDWQLWESENAVSYEGIAIVTAEFEKLGRRYGLTREFRENGII